jgi:hypothetical protein
VVAVIEWWDIDLKTFRIDLTPNRKLIPGGRARLGLAETNRNRLLLRISLRIKT